MHYNSTCPHFVITCPHCDENVYVDSLGPYCTYCCEPVDVDSHIYRDGMCDVCPLCDNNKDMFNDYAQEWLDNHHADMYVTECDDFGWVNTHYRAYFAISIPLVDALALSTDYTLDMRADANALNVRRYHHDSPTGETVTIKPVYSLAEKLRATSKIYPDSWIDKCHDLLQEHLDNKKMSKDDFLYYCDTYYLDEDLFNLDNQNFTL